jgi:NAD(P)-dependent dehydrogenase (short-subunit alcohol dehydrogenase family)
MAWALDSIPDLAGRIALVTGANSGIGFETARALARHRAETVSACRDLDKASMAVARIRAEIPEAKLHALSLDLADLDAVAVGVATYAQTFTRLDILICNAGVMVPPYGQTKQGFELQFGTNHLGHFALIGRLMPPLIASGSARVVVVSSLAAHFGHIDFDDLQWQHRRYAKWHAYGQSKLANLVFALELARRLAAAESVVSAIAAHPGGAVTNLQRNLGWLRGLSQNPLMAGSALQGAQPTLRAATDSGAHNGSYWGPSGWMELRGSPVELKIPARALDPATAERLWSVSEDLSGVSIPLPAGRAGDETNA